MATVKFKKEKTDYLKIYTVLINGKDVGNVVKNESASRSYWHFRCDIDAPFNSKESGYDDEYTDKTRQGAVFLRLGEYIENLETETETETETRLSSKQQQVIDEIITQTEHNGEQYAVLSLGRYAGTSFATIRSLVNRGVIEIFMKGNNRHHEHIYNGFCGPLNERDTYYLRIKTNEIEISEHPVEETEIRFNTNPTNAAPPKRERHKIKKIRKNLYEYRGRVIEKNTDIPNYHMFKWLSNGLYNETLRDLKHNIDYEIDGF